MIRSLQHRQLVFVGLVVVLIGIASLALAGIVATPSQSPQPSGAKSKGYNVVSDETFEYYGRHDNGSMGWIPGLGSPNFTVSYAATLRNGAGAVLNDGAQVAVGSTIQVIPKASTHTDIYWFGTGYSADSPYGDWGTTPPAVSCQLKDKVGSLGVRDIYIPFIVAPATRSITTSSNLTCGAPAANGSRTCTVNAAGPITVTATFGATTGKLYYRFYSRGQPEIDGGKRPIGGIEDADEGCFGNNTPMRVMNAATSATIPIGAVPISWSLTAIANNAPPSAPTISGPTALTLSGGTISGTYGFVATDPDADTIRYLIDWNNDGTGDQYLPAAGYVASGISQSSPRSWTTTGVKTFQARTYDDNNAASAWRSYSVTVSAAPQCSDGADNDYDGLTDLSDPGCTTGGDTSESPNPQCSDLSNNDPSEDSLIDYPNDPGCTAASDNSESPNPIGPTGTPSAYIEAIPDRVNSGNTSSLSWSAQNVTSCTVSSNNGTFPTTVLTPNASFQVPTSTPTATSIITTQSVYTLTCVPAVTATAIVNIGPRLDEF